jgi:hypothetical protein
MAERAPEFFDYAQPSYMDKLIAEEFTGDLSGVPENDKRKFAYKLKTRDENLKEL